MKIVVDSKETAGVIQQLCDIALKVQGLQALNQINLVLQSVVIAPPAAEEPEKS